MARPERPRVLLVHDAYTDYVTCLANAMAEQVPTTLLHSDLVQLEMAPRLSDLVRSVSYPHRRVRDPRRVFAPRAAAVAARVDADVVHFQQSSDPLSSLVQLTGSGGPPRVMTVHDVSPHPGDGTRIPGGHLVLRGRRHRVQRFITHTDALRTELISRWRVDEQRVDVVPHGELGRLYRRGPHAPPPPNPERTAGRVLFFGRVWPYKGLDLLVGAMNALSMTRPGLALTIAGTGESLDRYLDEVRGPYAVEVLDRRIAHEDVAPLFEQAHVVCLPYREASQSGVQALACGLGVPVVASAVGGLATAVHSGHDGLLVPPDDVEALVRALGDVLDDAGLRARLARGAASRCADDLAWETIAAQTLDVYGRARREERVGW